MARREQFTVGELLRAGVSNGAVTVLERDASDNIIKCVGSTVTTNAGSGYSIGCEFIKSDAATGQCVKWLNHGTATSCAFRPHGATIGYGFKFGGGFVTSAGGDTTETIAIPGGLTTDISLVDHQTSDDSDLIVAQIMSANLLTITGSADPSTAHKYQYGVLRNGCVPDFDIVAAGTHTTVGGAAAEDIAITGVLATDLAFATYSATNDTDTIAMVVAGAGKITVTMSANPATAHGLHYCVIRTRGTFKPSHYVFAAGVHTSTADGSGVNAITVTGAAATDVAIVHYNTSNDTDTILKAVLTANTLTVTMSADPSTAHKLAYMVLRAY